MQVSLPVVITPTRVESAQACQRKHVLQDVLEKGKSKSDALAFGDTMHAGVGAFHKAVEYRGLDPMGPDVEIVATQAIYNEWSTKGIVDSDRYSFERAKKSMQAYIAQYKRVGPFTDLPHGWKILTVEHRMRVTVGDYILSYQMDRGYQAYEIGRAAIGDLKTVSKPDAEWRSKWYRSIQMQLYKFSVKKTFGFDYDDIDFFIEGLDKAVNPKLHYITLPNWTEAQVLEAVEEFKRQAEADRQLIEAASVDGVVDVAKLEWLALTGTSFDRSHCFDYHSQCAFYDLCIADPQLRRGILNAEYQDIKAEY